MVNKRWSAECRYERATLKSDLSYSYRIKLEQISRGELQVKRSDKVENGSHIRDEILRPSRVADREGLWKFNSINGWKYTKEERKLRPAVSRINYWQGPLGEKSVKVENELEKIAIVHHNNVSEHHLRESHNLRLSMCTKNSRYSLQSLWDLFDIHQWSDPHPFSNIIDRGDNASWSANDMIILK